MPSADPSVEPGSSVEPVETTALCVDIGSTFTKALLVDLAAGEIVARAERPTSRSEVLDAVDACRADLVDADPRAADAPLLACSSAGGGLRIAVVGNEALVTAEAGRRVALSSGGKVVSVAAVAGSGPTAYDGTPAADAVLDPDATDVVLLTGGTDGGNSEGLLAGARAVVASGWTGPVVVAGNVAAHGAVADVLAGLPHRLVDNAVPRIGVLAPEGARAAIRAMFLDHVIGGKGLSRRPEFASLVRGATPDLVLAGVELLAHGLDEDHPGAGEVVVVDVGGATTDVYSVRAVDPELSEGSGLAREVVAPTSATRTVEGDLGMRWSAPGVVAAAVEAGDLPVSVGLAEAAARRAADPAFLPGDADEHDHDEELARLAALVACRRHAGRARVVLSPDGRVVERTGVDLRGVDLLLGSGGVLRHGRDGVAERVLGGLVAAHHADGWQLPERAVVRVDDRYALAAIGLLAEEHPEAAYRLSHSLWSSSPSVTS